METFREVGEELGAIRDELAVIRGLLERMDVRLDAFEQRTSVVSPSSESEPVSGLRKAESHAAVSWEEPRVATAQVSVREAPVREASFADEPALNDFMLPEGPDFGSSAPRNIQATESGFDERASYMAATPAPSSAVSPSASSGDTVPSDDELINLLGSMGSKSRPVAAVPPPPADGADKVDFSSDDLESLLGLKKG